MKKRIGYLIYVWKYKDHWAADLRWIDNEPGERFTYKGNIKTEYFEFGLKEAVWNVIQEAKEMNVHIKEDIFICYHDNHLTPDEDGEHKFPPLQNYIELLSEIRKEVHEKIQNKVEG